MIRLANGVEFIDERDPRWEEYKSRAEEIHQKACENNARFLEADFSELEYLGLFDVGLI